MKRMETVVAKGNACLLQMKVHELNDLVTGAKVGGGADLRKDY